MNARSASLGEPNPLVAVCGLYCGACSVYLATQDDPIRLARLATKLGQTVEDTRCHGCRAEVRSKHCRSCELAACAANRGHEVCGQCADYPCERFSKFQAACPHRAEIPADMKRIVEVGSEAWAAWVPERYACSECQTINSAYDIACRHCGHKPGSAFVASHHDSIQAFFNPA